MDVAFKNLRFNVSTANYKFFCKGKKEILKDIFGEFRSGELTAVVGPSGAGKSTLLNILAGYNTKGFSGSIQIECLERGKRDIGGYASYIMQEDWLDPLLTVHESMMLAAHLKLGTNTTQKHKQAQVKQILGWLGLTLTGDTRSGHLSGGQRKRLAIALELINNPPIMFFDEPTCGLDSVSSRQCIEVLGRLARQGRTVICTLHQPSAAILEVVDHLYCLVGGRCTFAGAPSTITSFLTDCGIPSPPYHNPADLLLEVCSVGNGESTKEQIIHIQDQMVTYMSNGASTHWRKPTSDWNRASLTGDLFSEMVPLKVPLIEKVKSNKGPYETEPRYRSSFFYQVAVLVRRSFIVIWRDKFFTHCRILMHVLIGLIIGGIYYRVGDDAAFVFENFSLLFFQLIFLVFAALSSMVISFPNEVPIIRRESFNNWYSIEAYYCAGCISDTPIQLLCSVSYCSLIYWLTLQPRDIFRFCMFLLTGISSSFLAQSLGYLVGASMKVQNGVIFGPLSLMPWVILSGYFLHMADAPVFLRWLFTCSYLRYGLEALMITVYGFQRSILPCSADYCHYIYPTKLLKELDLHQENFLIDICIIFGMIVIVRIITYFILMYQIKIKR